MDSTGGIECFPCFSISLARLTTREFVETVGRVVDEGRSMTFSYVHFHTINLIEDSVNVAGTFRQIDVVSPDGVAMLWSTKLMGRPLSRDNLLVMEYSMALLAPEACRRGWSIFLFGGDFGIAERAAARLTTMYAGLRIAGIHHGQMESGQDMEEAVDRIAAAQPTILLVGLGQPKQEVWINQYRHRLGANAIVGVGGYLEKLARRETIYPAWVNRTHLYWLYRLLSEPARVWRRYSFGALKYSWRLGCAVFHNSRFGAGEGR